MKKYKDKNRPVPILVNPSNPEEAVIFREVSTHMVMLPILGVLVLFGIHAQCKEYFEGKSS